LKGILKLTIFSYRQKFKGIRAWQSISYAHATFAFTNYMEFRRKPQWLPQEEICLQSEYPPVYYFPNAHIFQLLYIYILGWNVDFGHLEAVNLISANKYSEKQIGYLAMTLFLHEQHELLHLVVNSIRKDLTDHNELFNCLALHAIANVGGREMGEALSGEVHRLLISP
jgi:hypothetical protein